MNRTDRLLAIVLELQGKGTLRAADLAATFETCKRTIYRDIQALSQAGVPLVAVPGRGYALMHGYFLPPLNFTAEEATTLLLGSTYIERAFDAQYRAAAQSASRKIEGVLPRDAQAQMRDLRQSLAFVGINLHERSDQAEILQQLRRATIDRQTVSFIYHARTTSAPQISPTQRTANPYGLAHINNTWYLIAYCHLRQDQRHFRLDRMSDLIVITQTFTRPTDFTIQSHALNTSDNTFSARVVFAPTVARWVMEERFLFIAATETRGDGLMVTLRLRHLDDVVQWILSWGSQVRVLEPPALQQRLAKEAAAIAALYRDDE